MGQSSYSGQSYTGQTCNLYRLRPTVSEAALQVQFAADAILADQAADAVQIFSPDGTLDLAATQAAQEALHSILIYLTPTSATNYGVVIATGVDGKSYWSVLCIDWTLTKTTRLATRLAAYGF
jgi:hypothetical protein